MKKNLLSIAALSGGIFIGCGAEPETAKTTTTTIPRDSYGVEGIPTTPRNRYRAEEIPPGENRPPKFLHMERSVRNDGSFFVTFEDDVLAGMKGYITDGNITAPLKSRFKFDVPGFRYVAFEVSHKVLGGLGSSEMGGSSYDHINVIVWAIDEEELESERVKFYVSGVGDNQVVEQIN